VGCPSRNDDKSKNLVILRNDTVDKSKEADYSRDDDDVNTTK
jgi:hypothetical protein